jgi:hypothetical protein
MKSKNGGEAHFADTYQDVVSSLRGAALAASLVPPGNLLAAVETCFRQHKRPVAGA